MDYGSELHQWDSVVTLLLMLNFASYKLKMSTPGVGEHILRTKGRLKEDFTRNSIYSPALSIVISDTAYTRNFLLGLTG